VHFNLSFQYNDPPLTRGIRHIYSNSALYIFTIMHNYKLFTWLIKTANYLKYVLLFRAWHYSQRFLSIKPALLSTLFQQSSQLFITQLQTQLIWNMNSTSCNNKTLFGTVFTLIADLLLMMGFDKHKGGLVDPQLPTNLKWTGMC
jgi:hypothetical protein